MTLKESDFPLQFRQYCTQSGDGIGNNDITGDYSINHADYFFQPPPHQVCFVASGFLSISDNAAFNQTDYGAISGGVPNGVSVLVRRNGVEVDAFGGQLFKQNVDWFGAGVIDLSTFAGQAQTMTVRLGNYDLTGGYVKLDGYNADRIVFRFRDDFTSLTRQTVLLRGIYINLP